MNWQERLDELDIFDRDLRPGEVNQLFCLCRELIVSLNGANATLRLCQDFRIYQRKELDRLRERDEVVREWAFCEEGGQDEFSHGWNFALEELRKRLAALDKQEDTDERKD